MGGKDCVLLNVLKDEIKDNLYIFFKIISDWKFTLISVTKHSKLFCKNVNNFKILKSVLDIKILENLGKKLR